MQQVIELGRGIRDQAKRPLKVPLRSLVVVHTDQSFLQEIAGELREYVVEELNVRALETCDQPLQYAQLRAEPDWKAIGSRLAKTLGKGMNAAAAAIRAMGAEQIAQYEREKAVTVGGVEYLEGEIKVLRDFRVPEGFAPEDLRAAGDGEVLAVLDLRRDDGLVSAGLARELVNRVQKLRKAAGLVVTDEVEVFYRTEDDDAVTLQSVLDTEADAIRETLSSLPRESSSMSADANVIAEESTVLRSDNVSCEVTIVLVRPSGGSAAAGNGMPSSLQTLQL
jgi:isoleucyl-tRNA synthetase